MAAVRPIVSARAKPAGPSAWSSWRRHVAGSPTQVVLTLLVVAVAGWALAHFLQWAVLDAVWQPDADRCQAARGTGACWGVVAEKWRLVLLGRYPVDGTWRIVTGSIALLAGVAASLWLAPRSPRWLLAWPSGLLVFAWLAGGGPGLEAVPTDLWGGLPLTLFLTASTMLLAFPVAILLALGRRSALPALRAACTVWIEVVRGVPLVPVLFIASFVFPLLLSPGRSPDLLARVVVALALFAAAYMAEVVRGGLQSVPKGQLEAAASIGLGWWGAQRAVVLPQALRAAVPALTNNALSLLKETSLVTIVSLYELTGAVSLALGSDPEWRPFKVELFLVAGAIYFVLCFALARASARLELPQEMA